MHALMEDKIKILEEIWINSLRYNKFHSPRFKSCAIQRIHQICYRDKTEIEPDWREKRRLQYCSIFIIEFYIFMYLNIGTPINICLKNIICRIFYKWYIFFENSYWSSNNNRCNGPIFAVDFIAIANNCWLPKASKI